MLSPLNCELFMLGLISFRLAILTLAAAHPVPDGLVFRGIQVVVRSDKLEIRYQVGLSDAMIRRELKEMIGEDAEHAEPGGVEALARYRDAMFPLLSRHLKVTIEGRPVELIPRRADIVRQPHAQLEFVYEVALNLTSQPKRFELLDENYSGVPGYHLAAIRGRGAAQVVPAGSQELLARLPNIPETTDDEATPLPSVRKIAAYLQVTRPASESPSGGPTLPSDSTETENGNEATQSEVIAIKRKELSVDGPDATSTASLPPTDPRAPRTPSGPMVAGDTKRILWCVGFGGLALLIALAWLRSSRKDRRR
jgi:hypothetical protein